MPHASTRATTVEDIFYPSDPLRLSAEIGKLLEDSPTRPEGAAAVVAPHAALQFAGDIMAAAMKAASGRAIRRVVVLAPIHRDAPDGFVLPESQVFQCPLGDIEVDRPAVEDLLGCGTVFMRNDIPHLEEHSIEVLLPFVRFLFPEARLVPILTGKAAKRSVLALARALELCFGAETAHTLFVVSSCAAGSSLRSKGTEEEADRLLELVVGRRWEEILVQADRGLLSCCGARPLASVLAFGNIAAETRVLARSSSSDESGERVIHYAAVSCMAAR